MYIITRWLTCFPSIPSHQTVCDRAFWRYVRKKKRKNPGIWWKVTKANMQFSLFDWKMMKYRLSFNEAWNGGWSSLAYLISHETNRRTYRWRVRLSISILHRAESNYLFAQADVHRHNNGSENTASGAIKTRVQSWNFTAREKQNIPFWGEKKKVISQVQTRSLFSNAGRRE